ncbi:MAG: hypothetical protein ACKVT2_01155 [Saprospiraceae bacterium]
MTQFELPDNLAEIIQEDAAFTVIDQVEEPVELDESETEESVDDEVERKEETEETEE